MLNYDRPSHPVCRANPDLLQTRNSGGLVSLSSRLRLLALFRRHKHTTVLRTTHSTSSRSCGRSYTVRQRQSRYRRIPTHRPTDSNDGPRATANDIESWSFEQTLDPGADTRPQQTLLQHWHKLQKDRVRRKHADEFAQASVDRGSSYERFQRRA